MRLKSTSIRLNRLRCHARIGVSEQEKTVGNIYAVTVEMSCQLQDAMESDRVEDTVNYATVAETIMDVMSQPCNLLEHAAAKIEQTLFAKFPHVNTIKLELEKINPPIGAECHSASVILEAER